MSENRNLVPICIMYIDGVRLNTKCEGAFLSISIIDTINKPSVCNVYFDYRQLGNVTETFSLGSELKVQLGYKDDTNEVFIGEIVGEYSDLSEYGSMRYTIEAQSCLQRLDQTCIGVDNYFKTNKSRVY